MPAHLFTRQYADARVSLVVSYAAKSAITECTLVLSNIVHTGLLGGPKKQIQPTHVWSIRVWFDPVNRKMAQALLETLR
jgi:hypothetical protein